MRRGSRKAPPYPMNRKYIEKKERIKRKRDAVSSLKEASPCIDCGGYFRAVQMDYDHLGDKHMGVAEMVKDDYSMDRIMEEIGKCELVCANCHRLRTAERSKNFLQDL